jgi:truncated hemoglobin YjbI
MNEQIIAASMDESAFRQLTTAFYRRVRSDDLLGPMYPENDWAGAEERLADFLCFRFLGHTKYTDQRGHPRLAGLDRRNVVGLNGLRQVLIRFCQPRLIVSFVDQPLDRRFCVTLKRGQRQRGIGKRRTRRDSPA